ncbi:MAG: SDR family NAD(P)-dependent oxidoreductase, partial [Pseudomonadota bacterium]
MRLKGKTALVTGGGSGFGAGIVKKFALEGARVMIVDRDGAAARRVEKTIAKSGLHHVADVADANDVEELAKHTFAVFDTLDILVNNAGITHLPTDLEDVSEEDFDQVLKVNAKSVFLTAKNFVPHMKRNKNGVILNIASTAG